MVESSFFTESGSLNPWIDLMNFGIIGDIKEIETIATGQGIREIDRLRKTYGHGNWRKMKGIGGFYETIKIIWT